MRNIFFLNIIFTTGLGKLMNSIKINHRLQNRFSVSGLTGGFKILIPVFFLLVSCGNKNSPGKSGENGPGNLDPGMSRETATYKVLVLQPRSATLNTDYPANIQGLQNIEIRPKVDGFVEKIYVDEGSIVRKGQLLFKIDAPQYEQNVRTAQAGIKTAEADVSAARLQVSKVRPLVEKDIISHYELESAQYLLQSKEAALAQATAALVNARINQGYTSISSPVAGVIGSLPYKLGSLVTGTTAEPLTTVYNTSTIYAYFAMNEKQLLAFSRDSTNTTLQTKINRLPGVSLIFPDGSLYECKGKIETINGLINSSTGSANFRAAFVNPRGLLHSGSSAMVRMPTLVKSAILIPQTASYELQDKRFVYVIDGQNKVRNTVVSVMENTPGQFFVVTGGIRSGDKIIIESVASLKDGTLITPAETSAETVYKDLN